jgi:serine/threonine-protein kinase SRPK3/serine/threonine-protein kinase SRPK1
MSSDIDDYYKDWATQVLDNRYICIKKLDHGAYASVWICYDLIDRKYYAIKIHNRVDYKHGKKETRTYNELKQLKCDNIMKLVRSFDCPYDDIPSDELDSEDLEDETCHCCVLELEQCSIYNLLKKYGYRDGLPIDFIINVIKQLLNGLNILHKNGFIHADFKPENILLCGTSKSNKELFKELNIEQTILDILKNKKAKLTDILKNKNKKEQLIAKIKRVLDKYNIDSDDDTDNYSDDSIELGSTDTESSKSCSINSDISSNSFLDSDDFSDSVNLLDNQNKIKIDKNSKIKISDMGTCITPTRLKVRRIIQTEYYRSPELLLEMKYDKSSDIWALGCTIYEMLTGKILFNSDGITENGNENRIHLFLITQNLGNIPKELIKESPKKEILYTKKMDRIKGINKFLPKIPNIKQARTLVQDLEEILIEKNCSDNISVQFIDLLLKLLTYDPKKRITAEEALKHELFN